MSPDASSSLRFAAMRRGSIAVRVIAVLLSVAAAGASAQQPLNTQLLANTDFESATTTGWSTEYGAGFAVPLYGAPLLPATAISGLMSGGVYLANGNNSTAISQTFDVSGNQTDIDAESLSVEIGGAFGGLAGDDDRCLLRARFFNSTGGELAIPFVSAQVGDINNTHRNGETVLMTVRGTFVIPATTRSIRIELVSNYVNGGGGCNAMADNLSFKLVPNQTPAPLPLNVELLDNPNAETARIINPALTGWIVEQGSFSIAQYGQANLPLAPIGAAIGGGQYLFRGNTTAVLSQSFDVAGNQSAIDSGALSVALRGAFGGRGGDDDRMLLRVRYFTDGGGELFVPFTNTAIGDINNTHRNGETTLMTVGGTFEIPAGTRRLSVQLVCIYVYGSGGCNGYAENLSAKLVVTALPPAVPLGQQLLDNPTFDNGKIINPAQTGWIVLGGSWQAVPYGVPGFPLPSVASAIGGGSHMLRATTSSTISQTFDLAGNGTMIDQQRLAIGLSAYLGGFGNDSDRSRLRVEFYTSYGGFISNYDVGPVGPSDRSFQTTLVFRQGQVTIPVGARIMSIRVVAEYFDGANGGCNATADNLSASLIDITTPLLYPGSGEDFILESGVNALPSGGPTQDVKVAPPGSIVAFELSSPGGTFSLDPLMVACGVMSTGVAPTSPPGFPEVHIDPTQPYVILIDAATPSGPFGPPVVLPGGFVLSYVAPAGLNGLSAFIQGFAFSGGAANGIFAVTDAHEIRFN